MGGLVEIDHDPFVPAAGIAPVATAFGLGPRSPKDDFARSLPQAGYTVPPRPSETTIGKMVDSIGAGYDLFRRASQGDPSLAAPPSQWAPEDLKAGIDTAMNVGLGGMPWEKPAGALGAGGVKAYHGTPHDFDRFDIGKIGTGEGAQVYGHGLYFAEHPEVAGEYQRQLAGRGDKFVGGHPYDSSNPEHLAASLLDTFTKSKPIGNKSATAQEVALSELRHDIANPNLSDAQRATYQTTADLIESGKALPPVTTKPGGHLYQVEITAHPDHFLDWDKPLSEQSPALQKLADDLLATPGDHQWLLPKASPMHGLDLVKGLEAVYGREGASQKLRDAGVPGIRYLDAGSRASNVGVIQAQADGTFHVVDPKSGMIFGVAKTQADAAEYLKEMQKPQQTSNYVLFDDKLVGITHKNGVKVTPVDHDPFAE